MADSEKASDGYDYSSRPSLYRVDPRVYFYSSVIPSGVLVHTTSGTDSEAWLAGGSANAGRPASCDYLINYDGERVAFLDSGQRPYHAGQSRFNLHGAQLANDEISAALVGVEIEQYGEQLCTWQQLDSLAELIVILAPQYGWRWPFVLLGHYEVAKPVGRRSDPMGFMWGDFMGYLYARSLAANVPGLLP